MGFATKRKDMEKAYIDENFRIETDFFRLRFVVGPGPVAQVVRRPADVSVVLPAGIDFADPWRQEWLRRALVSVLREQAARLLPPRLSAWADRYGLHPRAVRVKNVRSRWGSCSSLGYINLSLWLLLAPSRLIDYVLKHELAHLREMNHGPRFWQLLDTMTENSARQLEREMRVFSRSQMDLFPG